MQWDDLRYVLALRRAKTLSAASRDLGVNHTTVARRVTALEGELGARLFDKTPAGFVATTAGEDILAVAEQVEQQMLSLDRDVLGKDARLSGPLRVTTIDIIATEHAPELTAFARRYPAVDLEVSVDNRPRSLTKREADVAIRVTSDPPEHLVGRRLGRLEYALYGARSLIAASSDPTDITAYPWLRWDERLGGRLTRAWQRKHVPNTPTGLILDSSLSMFAALRAGAGIAHAPCIWADRKPELQRIRDVEPNFGSEMWLLTHPDLRYTARVRAFLDHVGASMRTWTKAMEGAHPRYPALSTP